ncbi:MAG TPA: hypothetical protein PKB14_25860 [Rubrivivax sp.]|nr:hypothetical protein [Rubrivivax sp.]
MKVSLAPEAERELIEGGLFYAREGSAQRVTTRPRAARGSTMAAMAVALGTVKDGKVVLQGVALPEGTLVTVLADDDRPAIRLSPELEAELLAAVDEADAEPGGAGPEFIEGLKRYG